MTQSNVLEGNKTALVVIDFQEAFRKSITNFDAIARNISNVVKGFQVFGLPIIVTEQYPKGLGRTARDVLEVLPSASKMVEKTAFSSCGEARFLDEMDAAGVKHVVVCGLESHICVNQTVQDLLKQEFDVHILEDAVGSRRQSDRQIGLEKMKLGGAIPASVEMALFELMGDSRHIHFKDIQSLIK